MRQWLIWNYLCYIITTVIHIRVSQILILKCNLSACSAPPVPLNAYIEPPVLSAMINTVVAFQCMPGFIPSGPIESTCISEMGIPGWTQAVHGCIGRFNKPVQIPSPSGLKQRDPNSESVIIAREKYYVMICCGPKIGGLNRRNFLYLHSQYLLHYLLFTL